MASQCQRAGLGGILGRNCSLAGWAGAGMELPEQLGLPLDPWQCPRPGWTLGWEQPGAVGGVPAMAGVGWDGFEGPFAPRPFWDFPDVLQAGPCLAVDLVCSSGMFPTGLIHIFSGNKQEWCLKDPE